VSTACSLLVRAAPAWFETRRSTTVEIVGVARVPGTPWSTNGVELRISAPGGRVEAGETVPGTRLPARCPERHVQGDRTFCLGLRRPTIDTSEVAEVWWDQLRQYLRCQAIAVRTGVWPPAHALDHGEAGVHHERALALAEEAGLSEDYATAWLGEPSWITDPDLRIIDRRGDPINGRAPCPRGCRRRASRNAPVPRRKCPRRAQLAALVHAERLRREALEDYWRIVLADGTTCCRTMRACPIRDSEDRAAEAAAGSVGR
jgi:hypothetical protein